MLYRFVVAFFFLMLCQGSFASEVIKLDDNFEYIDLGKHIQLLHSQTKYSRPTQIKDLKGWKQNYLNDIPIADPTKDLWARFRVLNTLSSDKNIVINFGNSLVDDVEVYLIDLRRYKIEQSWLLDGNNNKQRYQISSLGYSIPFVLKANSLYGIYIRIRSETKSFIPIRMYNYHTFLDSDNFSKIFLGMVLGLILLSAVYSFMMYHYIRERKYLIYGLFMISISLVTIFMSGYSALITGYTEVIDRNSAFLFVTGLLYICLILTFFEMLRHLDIVRRMVKHLYVYLLYPVALLILCWFVSRKYLIVSNLVFIILCIISCFYVVQSKWSKFSLYHKLYTVFLLLFLVFWFGNNISRYGILYLPVLPNRLMLYFATVASLSLCFGLVYRTYVEKQSRIYAGNVHKHHSRRYMDMYHQANEGFFTIDLDGKLLEANKTFFSMLDYEGIEDYRMSCGPNISGIYYEPQLSEELLSDVILANQEDGLRKEVRLRKKDGSEFVVLINLRLYEKSETVKSYHAIKGIILDVSENRQIKSQIDYLKNHDVVTNLHNRLFMQKRVEFLNLEQSKKGYGQNCHDYFLFVDIDHFKVINNSCGSVAGDIFIQQIGKALRSVIPDENVARIGGDEFGLIVENCYVDNAISKAEEVRKRIQGIKFEWNTNYYSVTASIGIVACEVIDTNAILSLAETACGAAKYQGRNRVYLYSELSDDVLNYKKEIGWVAQIYKAIEQNKFVLFRQRIVTAIDSERSSYEFFVRLLGDNGNILPASTFIGAAKKFGLITHIDSWVVNSLHEWLSSQDLTKIDSAFINLSLASISSLHTHRKLRKLFERAKYTLNKLCFEISENSVKENSAIIYDFIDLIKTNKCSLALDHFECGIGSFELIERIRPNYVKIDCETLINFQKLDGESVLRELHEKIKKYNVKIVIMHVKTNEMYEEVKKYNFDAYQGFGIERPLPISLNGSSD